MHCYWLYKHTNLKWNYAIYIGLGILALIAAFKYTAGSNPYGYAGLGDLAVFLFFGLLPVVGAYFLNTHQMSGLIFLPAISIGLFSTGVLNLNNMRDVENDRNSGKNTMIVRMGSANGKLYHISIIVGGMVAVSVFSMLHFKSGIQWLFLFSFTLFIGDLVKINRISETRQFDPFLKKLSLTTLLFTLLFGIGVLLI